MPPQDNMNCLFDAALIQLQTFQDIPHKYESHAMQKQTVYHFVENHDYFAASISLFNFLCILVS